MLVWGKGNIEKLSLCCSIVYCYNGAQRKKQFLQVGWLCRALILLGLALCLPSASVSLVFMVLVGSGGQFSPSVWPHNPATGFRPLSATVVSAELFSPEQGHCGACRRKWQLTDTDLCPCGETQTMSHIVESCPLTKLIGGLSQLHSANEDAVSWLTSYGSWNAYEKKKMVLVLKFVCLHPSL